MEKGESKGIVTQKHHIFSLQTPTNSLQLIFHKHDTFFTAKNPHFSSTARVADPLKILMHIGWQPERPLLTGERDLIVTGTGM